jgi:hypothetical protein
VVIAQVVVNPTTIWTKIKQNMLKHDHLPNVFLCMLLI